MNRVVECRGIRDRITKFSGYADGCLVYIETPHMKGVAPERCEVCRNRQNRIDRDHRDKRLRGNMTIERSTAHIKRAKKIIAGTSIRGSSIIHRKLAQKAVDYHTQMIKDAKKDIKLIDVFYPRRNS